MDLRRPHQAGTTRWKRVFKQKKKKQIRRPAQNWIIDCKDPGWGKRALPQLREGGLRKKRSNKHRRGDGKKKGSPMSMLGLLEEKKRT